VLAEEKVHEIDARFQHSPEKFCRQHAKEIVFLNSPFALVETLSYKYIHVMKVEKIFP
jgi:hypothetical protein